MSGKKEKYVISDLRQSLTYEYEGEIHPVGRYGVWRMDGTTMVEVVESGDDLEALKEKYNTKTVVVIKGEKK